MTEELHDARNTAPKAIIWSVWIGTITGFVSDGHCSVQRNTDVRQAFLVAAMFCIRNLEAVTTTSTGVPLIAILQQATGTVGGALGLTTLITIIALVSLWYVY